MNSLFLFSDYVVISCVISNKTYKSELDTLSDQIKKIRDCMKEKNIFIFFYMSRPTLWFWFDRLYFYGILKFKQFYPDTYQQHMNNYVESSISGNFNSLLEDNIITDISEYLKLMTKGAIDIFIKKEQKQYEITIKFVVLPDV